MADADQPVQEISFTDAVSSLVSELPSPVQEFIRSPERDQIAILLSKKYSLHVDQAGIFQLAYLHMLIGVTSPEDFVESLRDAGISPIVVSGLTNDVNEMVFKPLREKERTGVPVTPSPVYRKTPQPVAPPVVVAAPTTTSERASAPYAGARPQPLTPFNLPGADAHPDDLFRSSTRTVVPTSTPMPVPTIPVSPEPKPAPIPTYVTVPPIPSPTVTVAPAPSPTPVPPPPARMPVEKVFTPPEPHSDNQSALGGTLRTMATDMLAVNEHRAPEPIQYKGTVYTPPVFMEAPTRPVPKPQLNRIQATPQPAPAQSAPSAVTRPTVTPTPARELIKEYSSDPYREPV